MEERTFLDLTPRQVRLLELVSGVSEQAGGQTRQLMKDAAMLQRWTDLPDPAALEGIGVPDSGQLDSTRTWYRESRLPGLIKSIYMLQELEEAGLETGPCRQWFEQALAAWSPSFLAFPFDRFWRAYESRIQDTEDELTWIDGILETILLLQNEEWGRLREMPDSPYVLVIAADYDARLERWFADVEAAIPLSRMALRQLAFVATQYCEEHSLAPMDEDGSVFVIGFREDGATLVPEIQAAGQLPGLIDEILRIVRPEL